MIAAVVLSHPDGRRQNVDLAGIPRVGEHVRLFHGQTFIVEHVLWLECVRPTDANIVLVVHPSTAIPE